MITVENLTKRYARSVVVDDLTFTVDDGESVALWGPNGAGKTTVVRCLLGLVGFEGCVEVDGLEVRSHGKAVRQRIGHVPQELDFYDDLTVVETLEFSAELRRTPQERIAEMVELVELDPHVHKRVGALSGGMKQRLGIALALLPDPSVLVLDEPTSNLDAQAREAAVELLEELRGPGRVMVVTSHHLEEVGMLVDRVLALEAGKLVADCSPPELSEKLGLRAWLHLVVAEQAVDPAIQLLRDGGFEARRNSRGVLVEVVAADKGKAVELLQSEGVAIEDLEVWR